MMKKLQDLTGPKKYAATFLLGAVMALAMPPVGAFPLLLLCVPAFIALARSAPGKSRAFLTGWTFGAGYFIAGFYWISAALFVDIAQWGWVMPLSLVVGPGLYALYYGFIPLMAWPCRKSPLAHALAMIAAWSIIEWLRGHLLTGFPWNLVGYTWMMDLPVLQTASVVGIYGLTLLTLLWAAIPALASSPSPRTCGERAGVRGLDIVPTSTPLTPPLSPQVRGEGVRIATALGISFILISLLGMLRLHLNPLESSGHTVRIVQANIPQTMKWDPEENRRNLEKHMALSAEGGGAPDFVVWPETAVTADLNQYPDTARVIADSLPGQSLGVFGALRVLPDEKKFFNSVITLDKGARVAATYDKHHLVPFGEYMPFRNVLNLTPIALAISNLGDFTRGDGPKTLHIGDLPSFSPLICYEVIFPHEVAQKTDRPAWLVNVTNDGWYGNSAGPYQHFEISRLRAIEEGLPLARAANTGISGMIDPLGRVIATQALGTAGSIDAVLPKPLPLTPYARFGDIPFLLMFAALALFAALRRV